jgi:TatD DNase family protein
MLTFTDSHCHLTMADAAVALDRAREQGVRGFVVPATKGDDIDAAVSIAQQHDDVWAAVGFHPHEAKDCDDAAFAAVERAAEQPRVVAIGECGLDYHYMHSPRETQIAVLERHIHLAKRLDKPIIIHNRESTSDMVDMLLGSGARGVLHSFTEDANVARMLIERGFYISFSGILTFRSADALRACAKVLPHDRVLIETDTPYLAPVPFRGRENEPAYVVRVAEQLASLWGVSLEYVAQRTTANFESLFGLNLS